MKIFSDQSRRWLNITALFVAVIVAIIPVLVSRRIHDNMVVEERNKVQLWAAATEALGGDSEDAPLNVMLQIISSNKTIPVILTNSKDSIIAFNNIRIPSKADTAQVLKRKLATFKKEYPPLPIDLGSAGFQQLYYGQSSTLRELFIFPVVQVVAFTLFLIILIFSWYISNKNSQNKLWVGLSKETAHQLGTPISSLMAWLVLLREGEHDAYMYDEIEKDIKRLETISHRFQKIGGDAQFTTCDVSLIVQEAISYLRTRISKGVTIFISPSNEPLLADVNVELFGWVIENLVKNAVDAMEGKGEISITISARGNNKAIIDITDTGKGIARQHKRKIFQPGFTTKKKGWGLGLSLARRIINTYHKGQLVLLRTEVGMGTTFRIKLPIHK